MFFFSFKLGEMVLHLVSGIMDVSPSLLLEAETKHGALTKYASALPYPLPPRPPPPTTHGVNAV